MSQPNQTTKADNLSSKFTTSRHNHNTKYSTTASPTHPKFGTQMANKLNLKPTPSVRRPVGVVVRIHKNKTHVHTKFILRPATPNQAKFTGPLHKFSTKWPNQVTPTPLHIPSKPQPPNHPKK